MTLNLDARDLRVVARSERGCTVLEISGELDIYTAQRLRAALVDHTEADGHRLVLDLSELTFIDSSGLGVLVGAFKQARLKGGALVLAGPRGQLLKILNVTGLDKVFPVRPDLAGALGYFDEPR